MIRLLTTLALLVPTLWAIGPGNQGGGGGSGTDSTKVLKAGDTMTGQLTLDGSSLTVKGSARVYYDVRAGSGSFDSGMTASSGTFLATGATQNSITTSSGISVGNNAGVTAGFFVGSGAGLTSLPSTETNTFTGSSKTVTGGSISLGSPGAGPVFSSNTATSFRLQELRVDNSSVSVGGVVLSSHAAGLYVSSMAFSATGSGVYGLNVTSGAVIKEELLVRQLRFISDNTIQSGAAVAGITAGATTTWTGGNTYTATNTVTGFLTMQGSGQIGVAHGFTQMIASGAVTNFHTLGHTFAVALSTGESFELESCFQNNTSSGSSQINLRFNNTAGSSYSNAMVGVESDDAAATVGASQTDGQIYLAASGLLNGIGTALGGCTLVTFTVDPSSAPAVYTSGKTVYRTTATNIAGMNNNSVFRGAAAGAGVTSFAITLGDGTYQWKYAYFKLYKRQQL